MKDSKPGNKLGHSNTDRRKRRKRAQRSKNQDVQRRMKEIVEESICGAKEVRRAHPQTCHSDRRFLCARDCSCKK